MLCHFPDEAISVDVNLSVGDWLAAVEDELDLQLGWDLNPHRMEDIAPSNCPSPQAAPPDRRYTFVIEPNSGRPRREKKCEEGKESYSHNVIGLIYRIRCAEEQHCTEEG